MAILELVKTEELAFRQAGTRMPLVVYRRADERFADELARMEQVFSPDPELNPDVAGLLQEKERMRQEAVAREEALWGGTSIDEETGEILPGPVPDGEEEPPAEEGTAPSAEPEPASPPEAEAAQPAPDDAVPDEPEADAPPTDPPSA